jgi:hypothetical protein
VTGKPLFGVIAALLLLIALWLLWTFSKVYFQMKLVARVERDVNRIGKRLEELSYAPAADYHTDIRGLMPTLSLPDENAIYKDLVQKFAYQTYGYEHARGLVLVEKMTHEPLN